MISLFQTFVNSYDLDVVIGESWEFLCSFAIPSAGLTLFESLAIICSLLCTALQVDLWPQLFASYDSENGVLQKSAKGGSQY